MTDTLTTRARAEALVNAFCERVGMQWQQRESWNSVFVDLVLTADAARDEEAAWLTKDRDSIEVYSVELRTALDKAQAEVAKLREALGEVVTAFDRGWTITVARHAELRALAALGREPVR